MVAVCCSVTACSHRQHGQDKTVLSCSCRRCEHNCRQDKTVLSCLDWRCEHNCRKQTVLSRLCWLFEHAISDSYLSSNPVDRATQKLTTVYRGKELTEPVAYQFGSIVVVFVAFVHFELQFLNLKLRVTHALDELRLLRVSFADLTIATFQQLFLCIQLPLYFLQTGLHMPNRNLTVYSGTSRVKLSKTFLSVIP